MMDWPFPDPPDPMGWDFSINGEWPFEDPASGAAEGLERSDPSRSSRPAGISVEEETTGE